MLISGPIVRHDGNAIWTVSTDTGERKEVARRGILAVPSPDGQQIAFVHGNSVIEGHTIALTPVAGGNGSGVLTLPEGHTCRDLTWSPDGRRLAWLQRRKGGNDYTVESLDLATGRTQTLLADPRVRAFTWRGRSLVFARAEDAPNETSSNLWEMTWESERGKVAGSARQLTNWAGFMFQYLTGDAAGRIGFIRWRWQADVHVADITAQGKLVRQRRLTFDERMDWLGGWDLAGTSVLLRSERTGSPELYIQQIDATIAAPVVKGSGEERDPILSPDGKWLLYLSWPEHGDRVKSGSVMRVPHGGGKPERVIAVSGYPGALRAADDSYMTATVAHPSFRCGTSPGAGCVMSEEHDGTVEFSAFEPESPVREPLFRVPAARRDLFWDLSPTGQEIAYGFHEEGNAVLHVVDRSGRAVRDIRAPGSQRLQSLAWLPNKDGFLATAWGSAGGRLLHIGNDGSLAVLYKAAYHLDRAIPSRDGKRVAFTEITSESNAWVIEPESSPKR